MVNPAINNREGGDGNVEVLLLLSLICTFAFSLFAAHCSKQKSLTNKQKRDKHRTQRQKPTKIKSFKKVSDYVVDGDE